MASQPRIEPGIPAGSMADIAFLMLIFYMVTTTLDDQKGLTVLLPPSVTESAPINERNLFTIQLNAADQLMVEGRNRDGLAGLREEIQKFILNKGADETLSDDPTKAVVSIQADRGTSYTSYLSVLDEVQAAYYEIYARRAGITAQQFRLLDLNRPDDQKLYQLGRQGIPMNISIAEPTGLK